MFHSHPRLGPPLLFVLLLRLGLLGRLAGHVLHFLSDIVCSWFDEFVLFCLWCSENPKFVSLGTILGEGKLPVGFAVSSLTYISEDHASFLKYLGFIVVVDAKL